MVDGDVKVNVGMVRFVIIDRTSMHPRKVTVVSSRMLLVYLKEGCHLKIQGIANDASVNVLPKVTKLLAGRT